VGSGIGFGLRAAFPCIRSIMPAKAKSGRLSLSANQPHPSSLSQDWAPARTRHKLWQARGSGSWLHQCPPVAARGIAIFVTVPRVRRGGGGIPHRIIVSSRSAPALRTTGRIVGNTPGIGGRLPRLVSKSAMMATWFDGNGIKVAHSVRLAAGRYWTPLLGREDDRLRVPRR